MERLDACYFCGTAADAPLREVTISPRARRDDPDAAVQVTLCPSCEDKLERVLGGLFDHVESRRTEGEGDASAPTAADDDLEASGRGLVDRIDVASEDGGSAERRGRRRPFTGPEEAVDVAPAVDGAGEADAGGDEDAEVMDGDDDAEVVDDDDAEATDDGPKVRARATASSAEALDGVSVAEYNRVMRLLQNREFPMARSAFVDLAASAYDLGEDTVEAVLDAVIDRDSLDERDGQLLREGEGAP